LPSKLTIKGVLLEWSKTAIIDKHVTYDTLQFTFGTMMLTITADLCTTYKLMV